MSMTHRHSNVGISKHLNVETNRTLCTYLHVFVCVHNHIENSLLLQSSPHVLIVFASSADMCSEGHGQFAGAIVPSRKAQEEAWIIVLTLLVIIFAAWTTDGFRCFDRACRCSLTHLCHGAARVSRAEQGECCPLRPNTSKWSSSRYK